MKRIATLLALLVALGVTGTVSVTATKPDPNHKVTICHALPASASHAYNRITVDIASSGYVKGGHHRPGGSIGDKHAHGGDIIPPYIYGDFSYPGQNWTKAGRAIYNNGCKVPKPTPKPPPETNGPEIEYDIQICGDPRAIWTVTNNGDEVGTFSIRFVSARYLTVKKPEFTLKPGQTRTIKRWVKGGTVVWIEINADIQGKTRVNKRNNTGACPR